MEGVQAGGWGAVTDLLVAVVSWLAAMLMGGLVTAHYRVSGLHGHGLVEGTVLGPVLREHLEHPRRFQVATGTLYLAMTVLGCLAWGRALLAVWPDVPGVRFYAVYTLSTVLVWSLGGVVFKMLAAGTAVNYGRVVGTVAYPAHWLLRPWSALLLAIMDRLDDTLWAAEAQPHLSAGEIRHLIAEEGGDATLDEDEREMIQSIFAFHDRAVREIMIPRIDTIALDGDDEAAASLAEVIASGHSRIPVYQGSVDRIIGILYSKDLLRLVQEDRFIGGRTLASLAREAYFIPESKKLDEVLDEFRSKRIHMAVVIDEYGGTAGVVTLEDVIEEIVGEIEDEFDEEETLLSWLDERRVRLDPKIDLEDLAETLGVGFDEAEGAETSETLGGLIYEAAGKVPVQGDRLVVAGHRVTVEKVVDQRIVRVLLETTEPLPGFVRRPEDES
ncbi:MAG: HlyC/CorC family transporter [bacterium]|nr:HlyC/CorC family transporter [bacterium]